ncbi:MAG: peptidylprolyl isomerase [Proteobacteria bacterium]|nr:peptidylprolyl isomerase [Pseudomonadota bacterium]MCH8056814.1 peptidylprolyl isomerase [Pseudomonadota bacterium]
MFHFSFPNALTMTLFVLASVAITARLEAQLDSGSIEPIDSIIALVDEDVILRSELDLAIRGIVDRIQDSGEAMPPMDLLENQVLERLIMRELQVQKALQTGIRISDTDIDQALVNLAQQNSITVQQLRQVIEEDGEDFAEFRQNIGEELLTDRLQQRIVNSMDPITDTEVDILLASEDLTGGEYNISHIMVALHDGATPQQIREGQAKIDDVYQRLMDGLDFASAAISYSDSEEALEGGTVGWRDLNSVPTFFADAIRELGPGETTNPIRSPRGFHILKVTDYREQRQVVIEEYHARHIMIEANELISPRAAMDKIAQIKEKLNNNEDFAELAKENSDDPTSANLGGDMGWFPPQAYGERVYQTLIAMQEGETSEPFQTAGGWHIMELLGKREIDRTEEAIRAEARDKIRQRKAEQEVRKVLRQFRDEAFVEIRLPGRESTSG